eukprot:CAMPEP_0171982156 /NCGR_PEP_ID=MMETSP0993-20121228/269802_1 /TAXON_ID=483369 /ORGANISM="non described non described, Strain CCMP2098" /LENGTH=53 /DNA_ID=CAMNT_0012634727 /DNA_START=216 /DNA_END=373 /DNA_ORIENTATION=-
MCRRLSHHARGGALPGGVSMGLGAWCWRQPAAVLEGVCLLGVGGGGCFGCEEG